ncbi:hypothetical protein [Alkalihalobacillus trypoxylicola]|uniref:Integral membrane protein n=1 Tax=Alkalihalobacillus trypoxylicola TaxID=519424 RepID=A0A161PJU0_9BACI|nr:hypothetical protein [Alkalihalobacillus trypoxylicola]KYG34118.1 hypothetical protein AZF04_14915 [Alkalihalobacillus trypoxylicola]
MSNFLLPYQIEIFITLEILSLICLLIFGLVRYYFDKRQLSNIFIILFISITAIEAVFAWYLYSQTGEISTLQIVISIFVLYAITFGVQDFKKLDRWMRKKIGNWRGINLLTEKDLQMIEKQKDPKYVAHKYRISSSIHLILFVIAQTLFISLGTESLGEAISYLKDLSWIGAGTYTQSPYPNETIYSIALLWGVIFIIDILYSWSYTLFPSTKQ